MIIAESVGAGSSAVCVMEASARGRICFGHLEKLPGGEWSDFEACFQSEPKG